MPRTLNEKRNSEMAKTILKINGMSCEHCVKTVTDCLSEQEGVER